MIFRFPFVLIAAVGVVSILNGHMDFHPDVVGIVRNYKDVVHPIWENSFGVFLGMFNLRSTSIASDYLS